MQLSTCVLRLNHLIINCVAVYICIVYYICGCMCNGIVNKKAKGMSVTTTCLIFILFFYDVHIFAI